jgi:hypothetical protein
VGFVSFALQQQTQRVPNVGLIVGQQDAIGLVGGRFHLMKESIPISLLGTKNASTDIGGAPHRTIENSYKNYAD